MSRSTGWIRLCGGPQPRPRGRRDAPHAHGRQRLPRLHELQCHLDRQTRRQGLLCAARLGRAYSCGACRYGLHRMDYAYDAVDNPPAGIPGFSIANPAHMDAYEQSHVIAENILRMKFSYLDRGAGGPFSDGAAASVQGAWEDSWDWSEPQIPARGHQGPAPDSRPPVEDCRRYLRLGQEFQPSQDEGRPYHQCYRRHDP